MRAIILAILCGMSLCAGAQQLYIACSEGSHPNQTQNSMPTDKESTQTDTSKDTNEQNQDADDNAETPQDVESHDVGEPPALQS